MDAQERLNAFIARGGINFSVGYEDQQWLITITRSNAKENDSVGGSFATFDDGINYCIDYLENVSRKRNIKSVRKSK